MKNYIYAYKDEKGEMQLAVSTELLLCIFLLCWAIPFIALFKWIWHLFKNNVELISKEDYYAQRARFYKNISKVRG